MFCEHVGFCFVRAAVRAISVFYWWEVGWRRRLLGCRSYPLCQPPRLCRITDDIGYGSSPASRAVPLDLLLLLVYRLAVNDLGLMSAVGHPLPSGSSSPPDALYQETIRGTIPLARPSRWIRIGRSDLSRPGTPWFSSPNRCSRCSRTCSQSALRH